MGHVEHLRGWRGPWSEAEFISALTGGGDSRLRIDPVSGTNKYFVPPTPAAASVCFSSCTASPISEAGFRQAMQCYLDLATARSRDDGAARRATWQSRVTEHLTRGLQLDASTDVLLLPSGTDGLLLCSILLSLEAGRAPMTAILPAAAETGSGVPRAAARQSFDSPLPAGPLLGVIEIPLRAPEGGVRPDEAISADFARASRTCAGRPVMFVTYGSKTGLVAPLTIPPGVEVVVDACQLRLSPAVIGECLRKGWPVVVTGSKFLGGPPFSGAVLLPAGRFLGLREKAVAEWSHIVAGSGAQGLSTGALLRWVAAVGPVDNLRCERGFDIDAAFRMNAARSALAQVPGVTEVDEPSRPMLEAAGRCPEIISFAVVDRHEPATFLTAEQLRAVHSVLACRGILLGQPVNVGPFGVLRLAIGLRDRQSDKLANGLDAVVGALTDILAQPGGRAGLPRSSVAGGRATALAHA
jgi:hypothetical protein